MIPDTTRISLYPASLAGTLPFLGDSLERFSFMIYRTGYSYVRISERYESYTDVIPIRQPFSTYLTKKGRSTLLLPWHFDKRLKKAMLNFIKNPLNLFKKTHLLSILFIQPVDFTDMGEQNMCDGCSDITVHKNELSGPAEWKSRNNIIRV